MYCTQYYISTYNIRLYGRLLDSVPALLGLNQEYL